MAGPCNTHRGSQVRDLFEAGELNSQFQRVFAGSRKTAPGQRMACHGCFNRSDVHFDFHGWRTSELADLLPWFLKILRANSVKWVIVDCGKGAEILQKGH